MKKIGRIKYVTRGVYDPETTYREMDVVLFEGSLWESTQETTGNSPPDHQREEDGTPASNEYWKLFLPGALGDDYVKKTDIAKPPTEDEPGKPGVFFPDGKTLKIDPETGELTGMPLDFVGETSKDLQAAIKSGKATEGMTFFVKRDDGDEEPDPDHPNNMLFPLDDYISKISSNAVKNWVIADALEQLDQAISDALALRASLTEFGLGKICPVGTTDVTEANGMVLGAFEKNPSIDGSLAKALSMLENDFQNFKEKEKRSFRIVGELQESQAENIISYLGINSIWNVVGYFLSFHSALGKKFFVVGVDCSDEVANRTSTGVQIGLTSHAELLKRKCTNGTWSSWENL